MSIHLYHGTVHLVQQNHGHWNSYFSMNIAVLILLLSFLVKREARRKLHRKLRVPTSERMGELSNTHVRARRAMHGEKIRKFAETRASASRGQYAFTLPQSSIQ
jgi:hypothetical protein